MQKNAPLFSIWVQFRAPNRLIIIDYCAAKKTQISIERNEITVFGMTAMNRY